MNRSEPVEGFLLIKLNTFEAGFLTSFLWRNKDERSEKVLSNVMKQLIDIQNKMREEAGVKIEKLPNGLLKMTSADGVTIVRPPYEWEEEIVDQDELQAMDEANKPWVEKWKNRFLNLERRSG